MFFEHWQKLKRLSGVEQMVGLQLLIKFDEERYPEVVEISDRELLTLTGQKSLRTIQTARAKLQAGGYCFYVTKRGKPTQYRLNHSDSPEVVTARSGLSGTTADFSYTKQTAESQKVVTQVVTCEKNTINARAHTLLPQEREKKNTVDDLTFAWEEIHPSLPLDSACKEKLTILVGQYDPAQILTAMEKSAKALSPYLVSKFSYMESCLEGKAYGEREIGGIPEEAARTAREGTGGTSAGTGLKLESGYTRIGIDVARKEGNRPMSQVQRRELLEAASPVPNPSNDADKFYSGIYPVQSGAGTAAASMVSRKQYPTQVPASAVGAVSSNRAERTGSTTGKGVCGATLHGKSIPVGHDGKWQNFSSKSNRAFNAGNGKEGVFREYADSVERRTRELLRRMQAGTVPAKACGIPDIGRRGGEPYDGLGSRDTV